MIAEVASRLGVPSSAILGRSEAPHLTKIRQVYWTLLRDVFGYTPKQIARMNNRSVSSISAGIKNVDDSIEMDDPAMLRLWDKVKDLPGDMEMEAMGVKS